MSAWIKAAFAVGFLALAGCVGVGIYHAGGDVPPPLRNPETKLTSGHAEGRRTGGKPSWSLDYDKLTASPDTTIVTLEHVRHGELYRRGKPYMQMKADKVIVNTLSNDFIVTGPLELIQNDGHHRRTLVSDAANYSGVLQTLTLNHPSKILSDGAHLDVASATVDFRSGDLSLGPIIGIY